MKKMLVVITTALLMAGVQSASAALASKVQGYTFWLSMPDANRATNSFPVTRDNLAAGLKLGGVFDSRGRENLASGLDFKSYFDAGDVTTTTGTQTLWRGDFNPGLPFTNNFGNRGYCALILVGVNGKVSIDRLSWKVFGGIMSGARDLAGSTYFPTTRIGINAGPDGRLWTADDTFVTSGAGTQEVDAIAYIGASLTSFNANSASDMIAINTYLSSSSNGLPVTVEYSFKGLNDVPIVFTDSTVVYPLGQVPVTEYGFRQIKTPFGFLWSLMAPVGSKYTVGKSPIVNGSYNHVEVTSGFTVPAFFAQNPMMFFRVQRIQ